jgi:hypothetical protein
MARRLLPGLSICIFYVILFASFASVIPYCSTIIPSFILVVNHCLCLLTNLSQHRKHDMLSVYLAVNNHITKYVWGVTNQQVLVLYIVNTAKHARYIDKEVRL